MSSKATSDQNERVAVVDAQHHPPFAAIPESFSDGSLMQTARSRDRETKRSFRVRMALAASDDRLSGWKAWEGSSLRRIGTGPAPCSPASTNSW